jgi:hypothetical protein
MRHKILFGIKLNSIVYVIPENRWDKVVMIDDHVRSFCLSMGGRYTVKELYVCSNISCNG